VVGAFFGGLAIRQTPQYKEVHSSVSAIGYSVFIPVFFADIGLSMTFASFFNDIWFIIVMTVLAILSKFWADRKSTRLNSSHVSISYAVFCLKKKNRNIL